MTILVLKTNFQYLVQAAVVGSRAREVVESFPPTGEYYEMPVDSSKARFGREDLLVEVHVRELIKLIISVQSNQKLSPTFLYDKLESYLRALETLGVTTDKCASILYSMVESCSDEEFLKTSNRSPASSSANDAKYRLENLMLFFKGEVEGGKRISLAMSGFGVTKGEDVKMPMKKVYILQTQRGKIPSASTLLASSKAPEIKKPKCVFCEGKHVSSDGFNAQKLTLALKQKIVLKNTNQKKEEDESSSGNDVNLSNVNTHPKVFLQTFKAKLLSGDKEKTVRVLNYTGSQKLYILKNIAEEMKYPVSRQETVKHSLFGGVFTKECKYNCYRIKLKQLNGNFTCNFEVLDQAVICENVLPASEGPWLDELKDLGVILTDTNVYSESIQVLIGEDIMGRLQTGKRKLLSSGLVAVETHLGWTLIGKVPQVSWVRKKDLHILTLGEQVYTNHKRFRLVHLQNSPVWTLEIKDSRKEDSGIFECQVYTEPKMSYDFQLNVFALALHISPGPILYIKSGASVNLTCQATDETGTVFLFWSHNGRVLESGEEHTEITEFGPAANRLFISKAKKSDSGNYSCQHSYHERTNIILHVLNGKRPVAMEPGSRGYVSKATLTNIVFLSFVFLM
ncbi:hypothetical protein AVEN_263489-1 [Araneus ventricosus]|uniref:Ig-like domain-containing protein n=1 Tax=Araneus ventricosus TaxID=182803 RepID=A0A4Y2EYP0_ARAVE|nr:hypothetical protein AVEN_263489-1 [Araneus ventricosus]